MNARFKDVHNFMVSYTPNSLEIITSFASGKNTISLVTGSKKLLPRKK